MSSYFLSGLLLCGILLHAGKTHSDLYKNIKVKKPENAIVKSRPVDANMHKIIPTVLLF
jgi:hypothetical protein